ncbi:hypothetical protein D3C80_1603820 [compost metagenome]
MLLEVDQLGRQRRAFRHEVGLQAGFAQAFLGQLVVRQQAGDLAHVDDAFDLVDVVAEHRQAGVAGVAQLADDGFQLVVEVDALDLVARDHQVVHGDLIQVEHAQQHALASGDLLLAGRLVRHVAAALIVRAACRRQAAEAQEQGAAAVQQP